MNKQSPTGPSSRLAVTYRALADLIPDPRNARTHPSGRSISYGHPSKRSASPIQFWPIPKAISLRAMAGFWPRG